MVHTVFSIGIGITGITSDVLQDIKEFLNLNINSNF